MLADRAPLNRGGKGIVVTSITHTQSAMISTVPFHSVISPMPRVLQQDSREGLGQRFLLCNQVVGGDLVNYLFWGILALIGVVLENCGSPFWLSLVGGCFWHLIG